MPEWLDTHIKRCWHASVWSSFWSSSLIGGGFSVSVSDAHAHKDCHRCPILKRLTKDEWGGKVCSVPICTDHVVRLKCTTRLILINLWCLHHSWPLLTVISAHLWKSRFNDELRSCTCDIFQLQRFPVPGTKAQINLPRRCLEDISYSNETLTEADFAIVGRLMIMFSFEYKRIFAIFSL